MSCYISGESRTWRPNLATPQAVRVLPDYLSFSILQALQGPGSRDLDVRPGRRSQIVVATIPNDKGITPIWILERIGKVRGPNQTSNGR